MSTEKITVLFMPESAYGPTNQCIGLGLRLLANGHRVVFAAEASWAGKLTPYGFEEDLVDLAPVVEGAEDEDAGAFWTNYIAETSPEFRKPTIDQLESFIKPTFQALIDGAIYCQPQLLEIIDRVKPDVIVEDNVVAFPALVTSSAPFVRIVSCNPLEIKGSGVAPTFSGLPQADDSQWSAFRNEYRRTHLDIWQKFNDWVVNQGAPALPELEFIHESQTANIYVYPEVADYTEARPLNSTWHRIQSSVRETDDSYSLPPEVAERDSDSALIYLSLGSLGSADVALMRRLISVLSKTKHKFIVSKGPMADQIELGANMVGAQFLPQTKVIPLVDLVITHGGNNTTTEALHFGKPMILLPLFWDQYDNAQRIDELGFGVRLATYEFADQEMHEAIDGLLQNSALRSKLETIGQEIRASDGIGHGVKVIEDVALAHRKNSSTA